MALASTPPERILPECGITTLFARAKRVMESSKITTSFWLSTRRFAFSRTMFATRVWCSGGSSNVEATTSALMSIPLSAAFSLISVMMSRISVTSSGRSSIRSVIRIISGWFFAMARVTFCKRTVLPVRGGARMILRWPLPIGENKSMIRVLYSVSFHSR